MSTIRDRSTHRATTGSILHPIKSMTPAASPFMSVSIGSGIPGQFHHVAFRADLNQVSRVHTNHIFTAMMHMTTLAKTTFESVVNNAMCQNLPFVQPK
jgi:hypothetical protein